MRIEPTKRPKQRKGKSKQQRSLSPSPPPSSPSRFLGVSSHISFCLFLPPLLISASFSPLFPALAPRSLLFTRCIAVGEHKKVITSIDLSFFLSGWLWLCVCVCTRRDFAAAATYKLLPPDITQGAGVRGGHPATAVATFLSFCFLFVL